MIRTQIGQGWQQLLLHPSHTAQENGQQTEARGHEQLETSGGLTSAVSRLHPDSHFAKALS